MLKSVDNGIHRVGQFVPSRYNWGYPLIMSRRCSEAQGGCPEYLCVLECLWEVSKMHFWSFKKAECVIDASYKRSEM